MLYLQASIHLHKVKVVVLIQQKFHRTGTDIIDRLGRFQCGVSHTRPQFSRYVRRRCFFDYFLMPPLYRTVALKQIDAVAMAVAKDLNLYMSRLLQKLFHQHIAAAKTSQCLALGRSQRRIKLTRLMNLTHPLATTAGNRFEQHRVTHCIGCFTQTLRILIVFVITGQ